MPATVIVPARGGSKRVPRKNTLPLVGVPIINRTLQLIDEAHIADSIVVSTDDDDIAALARGFGASVLRRESSLADDHTPLLPVMQDAIARLPELGISIEAEDAIALVYATAITMDPEDLASACSSITEDAFVVSVASFAHPPQRGFSLTADNTLEPVDPSASAVRTQDLPQWYHDAAQFVCGKRSTWQSATGIFAKARGYVVPRWRCVDLDTPEDLKTAEVLLAGLASLGHENSS